MPKQIEIEFFRYLQKIGETLAHLLSIKQSKFQLHKIKLHAIVIVKWLIPMEIRLENGFLTLSPFFFQGNGSKLVRNLVLGSYWYILGVQLMILIGDLISVRANNGRYSFINPSLTTQEGKPLGYVKKLFLIAWTQL